MKDIDLGMMAGAGIIPPPFARADQIGLDERAGQARARRARSGARTSSRRRSCAGWSPRAGSGSRSGQGFFPYARPDAGLGGEPGQARDARARSRIAWLDRPPANSISPEVVQALRKAVGRGRRPRAAIRALVFASANPMLFCAGADIKAFTTMDADGGRELLDEMHGLLRDMERSPIATIAAVNALAFGGGCELAMACDFRIAAESATFGQPEINLGIIPGFGGTQRLPRLVGEAKALELNLTGDPIGAGEAYELGLATRVVPDHELLDTALAWARKLAGQAPLAIEQIKRVSAAGDLDAGIEAEKQGVRGRVRLRGRPRGDLRLPAEAPPPLPGQVSIERRGPARRAPGRADPRRRLGVALTGAGISVPSGIPDFRSPRHRAVDERRPDGGRPHRRVPARPRALLALLRRPLPDARGQAAQRRPRGAGRARAGRAARRGDHPEHRPAARAGGHAGADRGARDDRALLLSALRRAATRWPTSAPASGPTRPASRAATAARR